jgi:hypothetical protein
MRSLAIAATKITPVTPVNTRVPILIEGFLSGRAKVVANTNV